MMVKMSSKKNNSEEPSKKTKKESTPKEKISSKKKDTKETKTTIPKEWKEEESEFEKGKRRSLISALKRSISLKSPSTGLVKDPMNIVVTLSPAKHLDIIDYIEETVAPGGRAEWVRDSIRLKIRIEKGIYGLNTGGEDTQKESGEAFQQVMGQFAEVMTKIMSDLRTTEPSTPVERVERSRPLPPAAKPSRGGPPPAVKKVETDESKEDEEAKPDRPSLEDAMSAIIVVH
jgi:hypothetical protein